MNVTKLRYFIIWSHGYKIGSIWMKNNNNIVWSGVYFRERYIFGLNVHYEKVYIIRIRYDLFMIWQTIVWIIWGAYNDVIETENYNGILFFYY